MIVVARSWLRQPIYVDRNLELVVERNVNLSALRHADQRSRVLQLVAGLAEGIHRHLRAMFALRMPNTFADIKLQGQYSVAEFTSGMMILVGCDRR